VAILRFLLLGRKILIESSRDGSCFSQINSKCV